MISVQNTFSQLPTYYIKDVKVNGTSIPNNSPINFGSNTSVLVRFTVEFNKPNDLNIGAVVHVIGTNTINGFVQLITPEYFTLGIDNAGFSGVWEKTLYASDYSYTGGNYLISKITQTSGQNGNPPLIWESNQVVINRTTQFTLTPTTFNINCGDTNSKTFSVSNSGLPSGSTVAYTWNVGSGWSGTYNSSMSSINLTPISFPPGNISVTPILNGVAQPTKNCVVTLAPLTNTVAISGSSTNCSSSSYSVTGLITGQTVTWSSSNTAIATVSPATGTSTTLTKVGNGEVTLTATVSNACSQSKFTTKQVLFGSPQPFQLVRASNEYCDGIKYHYVPFEIPNSNPLITYTFTVVPIPGVTVTVTPQTYNGVLQYALRFPKTYNGYVDFTVKSTNSCGTFTYYAEEFINNGCNGGSNRMSDTKSEFKIYPNPSKDYVNIELDQSKKIAENTNASVYDLMGVVRKSISITDYNTKLYLEDLKKGIYILKINSENAVENHQLIIE